ncbi:hypothetical protein LguiA_005074 [Lonicera macranthoides]
MEGVKKIYQEKALNGNNDSVTERVRWMIVENGNDDFNSNSTSSSSSSFSSSDVVDDASSSSTSSSSSSYGPLYELSELMAQLPIKRGISKYYQGKSESFGCLASVNCLEDLAKKGYSFRNKRVKPCNNKSKFGPKVKISKKTTTAPRVSCLTSSSSQVINRSTFAGTCRALN